MARSHKREEINPCLVGCLTELAEAIMELSKGRIADPVKVQANAQRAARDIEELSRGLDPQEREGLEVREDPEPG